jgi:hypothetical protein
MIGLEFEFMGTEQADSELRSEVSLRDVAKSEFANLAHRETVLLRRRHEIDAELSVIAQLKKTYMSYEPSLRTAASMRPRSRRIGETLQQILMTKPGTWFTLPELEQAVAQRFPGVMPTTVSVRNALAYLMKKNPALVSRPSIHGIQYQYSESLSLNER